MHHIGLRIRTGFLAEMLNTFADTETDRDNRNLKDDAENQRLKKEDLQKLRKSGVVRFVAPVYFVLPVGY